jgi:hypothetical protein
VTSSATSSPAFDLDEIQRRIRAAVSAVAATEPDPVDPFRGLYISDESARGAAAGASVGHAGAALAQVAARLGLDRLDAALLAFCATPELDARYGRLLAYLHDDVTRRLPTPRLAARLLATDEAGQRGVLARFGADAALRGSGAIRLLDDDATIPLADRPVKLDERLAARLVGADLASSVARARERFVAVPRHDPGRGAAAAALRRVLEGERDLPVVACGADAAALVAWALERPVLALDARDAADAERAAAARVRAALEGAEPALEIPAALTPEERAQVRAAVERAGPALLVTPDRRHGIAGLDGLAALLVEVPSPSPVERLELWRAHTGADGDGAGEVAAKFRLSMRQIDHAARVARLAAQARGNGPARTEDLERGAREASRTQLGELATLLDEGRDWADLVLPEPQREQLRSVAAYLRHRDRVLAEWGYERAVASQGLKVLFAGESGTGKTMAAQVLAADLGLDAYRVDLATVVSKYIGETERNLDRIFACAEGSNAILFFDEADALFGKRSEVKDAHDRYANIEVAYLLQRMETYPGAVVLATNYRRNIDEAFMRRLDFVIDFPFPEADDRVRIWQRLLPDDAPVAPDVDVDALAHRFELAGGSIRNCSVAAAFMAADDGGTIEMRHLVQAVAAEYRKMGRLTMEGEFGADRPQPTTG